MRGTASVAPTAGMATPESLTANPIASTRNNATRPGRKVGAASNERCSERDDSGAERQQHVEE